MPAAVTLVRATYTDVDSIAAAAFNACTAVSATVPDATAGNAGVMPASTTAAGLAMIAAADAAAQRTLLGLVVGTDVQAYDADLAAIAALATTNYGRSFLTQADAAEGRTLLGLGTIATQAASAVAIAGGTITGTTISGSTGSFSTISATVAGGQARTLASSTTTGVYERVTVNGATHSYWGTGDQIDSSSVNNLAFAALLGSIKFASTSGSMVLGGGALAVTGTGSFTATTSNALTVNRSSGGSADIRFQRGGADKGFIADNNDGVTIFNASAAQLMAVTSSGTAVTGTSTTTASGGAAGFNGVFSGSGGRGIDLLDSSDTSGATFGIFRNSAAAAIGSISRVTTTNAVAYNTASAREVKESIEDCRNWRQPWDILGAIPIRVWDWKRFGTDPVQDDLANLGVVYDEVLSVFPDVCTPGTKEKDKNGRPLLPDSVNYPGFIPLMIAAQQDDHAELASLRARVAQLEAA